jgi:hypothetical protein
MHVADMEQCALVVNRDAKSGTVRHFLDIEVPAPFAGPAVVACLSFGGGDTDNAHHRLNRESKLFVPDNLGILDSADPELLANV